jgi:hypothetical protein
MASLVGCIKKAGDLINAEDKAAVLARVKELRSIGLDESAAARQAVRERIGHVETLRTDAKAEKKRPKTADEVATEKPELLVRPAGTDETLTVAEALARAKHEATEIAAEATWVQAALGCALSG